MAVYLNQHVSQEGLPSVVGGAQPRDEYEKSPSLAHKVRNTEKLYRSWVWPLRVQATNAKPDSQRILRVCRT